MPEILNCYLKLNFILFDRQLQTFQRLLVYYDVLIIQNKQVFSVKTLFSKN